MRTAIVAVLLLLTYRGPVPWLAPLLAAGLAVMVARGARTAWPVPGSRSRICPRPS